MDQIIYTTDLQHLQFYVGQQIVGCGIHHNPLGDIDMRNQYGFIYAIDPDPNTDLPYLISFVDNFNPLLSNARSVPNTKWVEAHCIAPIPSDNNQNSIKIYSYKQAPTYLQLSKRPGNKEKWIAVIPPNTSVPSFIDKYTQFAYSIEFFTHPTLPNHTIIVGYNV